MGILQGDGILGAAYEGYKKKKQSEKILSNPNVKKKLNEAGWDDEDLKDMDSETLDYAMKMVSNLDSTIKSQKGVGLEDLKTELETEKLKKKKGLLGITKVKDVIADALGGDNSENGIDTIEKGVGQLDETQTASLDKTIREADGLDAVKTSLSGNGMDTTITPTNKPEQTEIPKSDTETTEDPRLEGLAKVGVSYIKEDGKLAYSKSPYQMELEAIEADKVAMRENTKRLDKADSERLIGAQKSAPNTVRQIRLWGESIDELKAKIPDIEKSGIEGFGARLQAEVMTSLDEFPVTRALNIRAEIIANQTARDVEGGRVTDADRKIYSMGLANAMREPSATNVILAAGSLSDLYQKGGDITPSLILFANSEQSVFRTIVGRVLDDFPELISEVYGEEYEIVEE